jgi:hypothetical protein
VGQPKRSGGNPRKRQRLSKKFHARRDRRAGGAG